jgi:hypothetical protein
VPEETSNKEIIDEESIKSDGEPTPQTSYASEQQEGESNPAAEYDDEGDETFHK